MSAQNVYITTPNDWSIASLIKKFLIIEKVKPRVSFIMPVQNH